MASPPRRQGWKALAALLLAAAAGGSLAEAPILVTILSPDPAQAAFGEVEFAVEVSAPEPIQQVEFLLDGTVRARDDSPPYRVTIDAGDSNVAKRFTAVAYGLSGKRGSATIVTPSVAIDLKVEVALQQLYVTVTRDEQPVSDLERDAFRIFDSGVEQRLVTFARGDIPMTIVLLLDASESMTGSRLQAALRAAHEFLHRLQPLDEAMALVFSDRPLQMTRFSSGDSVSGALAAIAPESGGGTALNDHLYAALRLLDARQGRPVVLLLSDGADTLSLLRIADILWKSRRSDAVLYRIRPTEAGEPIAFATSWRGFQENRSEIEGLAQIIRESGGGVRSVPSAHLEVAIGAVLDELRQQYVLGYYPTARSRDGTWRPVRVEVTVPGLRVRTRTGYIDR